MSQELRNAFIDLQEVIRTICALRRWYMPDGTLASFSHPVTAPEAAESLGIEDWASLEPYTEASHS